MMNQAKMLNKSGPAKRVLSLDALRGFAIITMILSGVVPGGLPAWMYHAQTPPPARIFDGTIPGITWVDLVFPFFLFSMGAAIPLALVRRIERGASKLSLVGTACKRLFLLFVFAKLCAHFRPWVLNPKLWSGIPTPEKLITFVYAFLGFILMFAIFVRLPRKIKPATGWIIRAVGWIGFCSVFRLFQIFR